MKIITEVQNNSKDTEEIMVALDLNDNADDALFRDKTLITTIYLADYARFKRSYLYCKEYGVESMVEKYSNNTWCIDASLNEVIAYMNTGKTPNDAEKHFGDLREDNPLLGFESLVDSLGSIYLEASHKHVHGKGFAEISLPELDGVFSFIESRKAPKLSREDFMEFWRSDDMAEVLTADDRLEIFTTAPIGASDINAKVLNEIIDDYNVENLSVIDTTPSIVRECFKKLEASDQNKEEDKEDIVTCEGCDRNLPVSLMSDVMEMYICNECERDNGKLEFYTIEDGKEEIIALYAKSEIVSGEFADNLYENRESEFNASIPLPIVMGAIQAFRAWDWKDDEDTKHVEIECEVEMMHNDESDEWYNEFHDYMYDDGSFIPGSTRVGVEIDGELVLDKGISYASVERREESGDE